MDTEVHFLGIRHHGAGSARNAIAALQMLDPDVVLVEGPEDCQHLIQDICAENLVPPVAMMVYSSSDFQKYAYYPFTVFSPEWQALQWANQYDKEVTFFDLPHGRSITLKDRMIKESKDENLISDPFGYLAQAAGYSDAEAWWDDYIEQEYENPLDIFRQVADLMIMLRGSAAFEHRSNHVREAFMRSKLRAVMARNPACIVVVCGAWHVPPLLDWQSYKATHDNKLWKAVKMERTSASWVPWSYQRIARHSGYGSGVVSPYWYEALFVDGSTAIARWMSRAAAEMRRLGQDVSAADAIAAGQLAQQLTDLRAKNRPGIDELFDACSTAFCDGNPETLAALRHQLLEGDKVGQVAAHVSLVPLQADIERQIKSCRLGKAWQSQAEIERELDVRKPNHLRISRLLHRLALLQIPWGREDVHVASESNGFREYWKLAWYPDFQIRIVEASLYGHTLVQACQTSVEERLQDKTHLDELAALLMQVLKADLTDVSKLVAQRLAADIALSDDVGILLQIGPSLLLAERYGSTRQLDTKSIVNALRAMVPRLAIALPVYAMSMNEELARETVPHLASMDQALKLADVDEFNEAWQGAFQKILERTSGHGLVRGLVLRALFDRSLYNAKQIGSMVSYELSNQNEPMYALHFLESFLKGGGTMLLHHRALRASLDQWISSVSDEYFMDYLVLLRRIFSTFSKSEKENLYALLTSAVDERDVHSFESGLRREVLVKGLHEFFS